MADTPPPLPMTIDWGACPEVERVVGKVSGAWVFTGTRIPLSSLYENLAHGATVSEFVAWFPASAGSRCVPCWSTRPVAFEPQAVEAAVRSGHAGAATGPPTGAHR